MKRNLVTPIVSLLLGGLLGGAVIYAAPMDQFLPTIRSVRIGPVMAAIVTACVATLVRTLRVRVFLPGAPAPVKLLGGMSLAVAASSFIPADVALFWGLRKYGEVETYKACLRPWIGLRLYDLAVLMLMLGVVVVVFPAMGNDWTLSPGMSLIAIGFIAAAITVAIRYLPMAGRQWIAIRVNRAGLFQRGDQAGLVSWRSAVMAMGYWGLLMTSTVLVLVAFAPETRIEAAVAAAMTVVCLGTLPLQPPMSIGTAEAGWVFALTSIGLSLERSATIAIGVRLITTAILLAHVLMALLCLPFCGGVPGLAREGDR